MSLKIVGIIGIIGIIIGMIILFRGESFIMEKRFSSKKLDQQKQQKQQPKQPKKGK